MLPWWRPSCYSHVSSHPLSCPSLSLYDALHPVIQHSTRHVNSLTYLLTYFMPITFTLLDSTCTWYLAVPVVGGFKKNKPLMNNIYKLSKENCSYYLETNKVLHSTNPQCGTVRRMLFALCNNCHSFNMFRRRLKTYSFLLFWHHLQMSSLTYLFKSNAE